MKKKTYPVKDGNRTQYVRHVIEVTTDIIEKADGKVMHKLELGKFIAVDVLDNGYQFLPACRLFDNAGDCQKSCDAHNSWIGFTRDEADLIIYNSMKNGCEQKEGD